MPIIGINERREKISKEGKGGVFRAALRIMRVVCGSERKVACILWITDSAGLNVAMSV